MPKYNYNVNLSTEEIEKLKSITHKGAVESARTIMYANILLFTNDSFGNKKKSVRETAELFEISPVTVNQVRKLYATEGIEAALARKTRLSPPHISKMGSVTNLLMAYFQPFIDKSLQVLINTLDPRPIFLVADNLNTQYPIFFNIFDPLPNRDDGSPSTVHVALFNRNGGSQRP